MKSKKKKTLLQVRHLNKSFHTKTETIVALHNVTFDLYEGETFGLVGKSGSGKSTLAKILMRFISPDSGSVSFLGNNLFTMTKQERIEIQMVFQDPYSSLNPRMTAQETIEEPLYLNSYGNATKRKQRIAFLLDSVGLSMGIGKKYPHELSGGQRQRVGIARALSLNPKLLILDEPITALDVSIQAQIIELLKELQLRLNLTYLFISHDLRMVRYLSDEIYAISQGKLSYLSKNELIGNLFI